MTAVPSVITYLFLGLTFFMLLYTIGIFYNNRKRALVFYAIYLVANFAYFIRITPIGEKMSNSFGLEWEEMMRMTEASFGIILVVFHYFLFISSFFDFPKNFPNCNKAIQILVGILSFVVIIDWFFIWGLQANEWSLVLESIAKPLTFIPILFLYGCTLTLKTRQAFHIIIGGFILMDISKWLTVILYGMTSIEITKNGNWYIWQAGNALEYLFFATVFILDVKLLESQYKLALKELNEKKATVRNLEIALEKSDLHSNGHTNTTTHHPLLKEINDLLEEEPGANIEEISHKLNISHFKLIREIKKLTGKTPKKYIQSVRLEKAKFLLLKPQVSIAEVAYHLGYNDPAYFSKVFYKEFGILPSHFAQNGRDGV